MAIDSVYNEFDKDRNGLLDAKEAKSFVNKVLSTMYGPGKYNLAKFDQWFSLIDVDRSNTIEKNELVNFIIKLARQFTPGFRDDSAVQD